MTERKVVVKNLEVNYKIVGEGLPAQAGRPFLILHGWGSKSDRWEKTAELLSKKGMQVVIPDLPGFGKSQEPDIAWNLNTYVEWLAEFCTKIPELNNNFYLLGHSFGGALSAKFSIKYNQKVQKLFLVGAAAIRKKTIKKQVLGRVSKLSKIFSFVPFYPLAKKAFYKFVVGGNDYLRAQGVMKETFLQVISDDLSQFLSSIKVPTVIIWGDKDDTTLVEDAYFIQKKILHSTLSIIPGGDHDLEVKVPELLAEKILENI
jgi:pimeloyl-ACP methyl ester carboxylesterase